MVIILEAFQNQYSMQWYNTKPCFSSVWAGLDQTRHSHHSNVDKMELWQTVQVTTYCSLISTGTIRRISLSTEQNSWRGGICFSKGRRSWPPYWYIAASKLLFAYFTFRVHLILKFFLPSAGGSSYRPQEFTPSEVCMHTICRNGICFDFRHDVTVSVPCVSNVLCLPVS